MQNSVVGDNVGASAGPGVRLTSAEATITYSVIVSNGTFAAPNNVECLSGATGTTRNSIIAGPNGDSIVTCGNLQWSDNAVDTSGLGASNQLFDMYDSGWFNPTDGDYHLTASGETEFMDIAQWQDGDPLTDVDGDAIPYRHAELPRLRPAVNHARRTAVVLLLALGCGANDDAMTALETESNPGSAVDASSGEVDADTIAVNGTTEGRDATGGDDDDDGADGVTSTGTTEGGGCVGNEDCTDGAAPFCDAEGACVSCSDLPDGNAACAEADGGRPVCGEGTCVECTAEEAGACEGQRPVCGVENTCDACTEHFECPDSACHLDGPDVGACFDEGDVQMIANTGQLNTALGALGAGDQAVLVLAGGTYGTSVDISLSAEVAILGGGGVTLAGDGGLNAVELIGSSITYFEGVEIANISGNGIVCSATSVWLDDSEVRNNAQAGLDVSGGCVARLRRTIIASNDAGGISASGDTTEVLLVNSAVVDNTNTDSIPAISLQNSADIFGTYSTITDNLAGIGETDSMVCSGSSGEVRNSIVLGAQTNSISGCTGVTFSFSAVDENGLGASNVNVGAHEDAWFANPLTGNYHLSAAGETTFMDIAEWQDGDPVGDVDGDPIPTDMPSFPGFDQP